MRTLRHHTGSTLIEVMVSVAILGILASIAVPSFQGLRERARVQAAAEAVYAQLAFSRSEGIKQNRDLFVSITQGASTAWCVGLSNTAVACNCNTPSAEDACQFGPAGLLAQRTLQGNDFPGVTLSTDNALFGFESRRGSRLPANDVAEYSITLTGANAYAAQVQHNARGRLHLCGNVGGYTPCP